MRLATRLAILCGAALVAIITANTLYTVQTNRISALYEQRQLAREAQVTALDADRDLQSLLAAYSQLLATTDTGQRTRLQAQLDGLDSSIDTDLRSAAQTTNDDGIRRQYQQAVTSWETFRRNYRDELDNIGNAGDAAVSAIGIDAQTAELASQLDQIEQETARTVDEVNQRASASISASRAFLWTFVSVIVVALGVMMVLTSRNIHRTVTASASANEKARRSKEIQAELMTEVQSVDDLAAASGIILTGSAKAVDAKHAALYLQQPDEPGRFALTASYAFQRRKGLPNSYGFGEGLVGQCALEGSRIEVTGAPADYVEVVSGLGKTEPMSLILVPIKFEHEVLGVIELAGLRLFSADDVELLESIALGAGVALSAIESAQKTRDLLRISQAQTEELQTQEEELRAANEQLTQREDLLSAQNAELEETTEELRTQKEELRASSERLEAQARALEEKNEELQHLSASLEAKAEELAVSSRYKSEFLANMSHELRTPLNSILILAGLLTESDEPLNPRQHEFAETIQQSGKDLLNLIDEVLDLAKVESGSLRVETEPIEVAGLVTFLERTFRHMAEDKNIEFGVVVDPAAPPRLTSDYTRVKQIAKNLVANAIKFTDEGSVTVRISGADDTDGRPGERYLSLAVVDTGIGIDEKDHHLIFESFQQAGRGSAKQYGGTGLGLAISRELARHLGGDIALRSTLGQGSTFTCYLPVEAPAARASERRTTMPRGSRPAAAAARPAVETDGQTDIDTDLTDRFGTVDVSDVQWPQGGKPVLLIVEDDPTFARMLAELAAEAGFASVVTSSGRKALALAKEHQPAAITLDIGLPDMAGWVVLDVLKHDLATRHIPVNVVSGTDDDGRGRRMGAIHTLNKPAEIADLRSMFTSTADFLKPGPRNVLVAEDDANQRQVVKHMIESDDIAITCVGTGEQVLAELSGPTHYDCVVLDLGLPDIDGIDLIERIKDQLEAKHLPVIVHTGRELTPAETERLEDLAAAIVLKNARSPERLLDETALFLHRVADDMPNSAREILANPRRIDESLEGNTVLLVDDDVRNVFSLGSALKRYGITVLPARNGQAGIDTLDAHPEVGLVLMDIMMPVMDGYEAMRRIRADQRWRNLPIVALTAKAMKGDRQKCLEAGASDYVTKPVDMDQLTSVLRVWLASRPRGQRKATES
ncbi:response regulator [Mycolicibacterium parafortuitum]|uniref:Circadian input-output histidine kinase CikA n=1 Tax=Mycolicibacterium parafortuitum TaxID=39692 RepID=A0A375YD97_MYCPF|nr:response regulator [Mycolicibacterium parafortuitum]ORB31028.1 two-component system sensor histidine kinase/response regulator [Mycolicibacterium parafortuitum]SRX79049.1 GAF sensor hybrid histidine kinase [Crinalium epipsammum PCC 9333] [Mycolicibacterium parafortuitum]